jgi:hypothetical protein
VQLSTYTMPNRANPLVQTFVQLAAVYTAKRTNPFWVPSATLPGVDRGLDPQPQSC